MKIGDECEGPLVWFDVSAFKHRTCKHEHAACVIECAKCGYIVMSGNYHDDAHARTDVLRSPK